MSSLETLKTLIEQQLQLHDQYKAANDERLAQIEKRGAADAVTAEKVEKLSAELDRMGDNLKALEKLATRPDRGGDADPKATQRLATANLHMQALAAENGRATKVFADVAELARYEAEFGAYLRQGRDAVDLHTWVRQDFQIAVGGDGGFLVPPDMSGRIVTRLYETSDIRGIAMVQNVTSSELMGIADTADISFWWAGEAEPDADSTNTTLGEYQIQVEELRVQPKASLRLLADAAVNVESWLAMKIADRLARGENAAFVTGDGSKKPRGFTTYTTVATADASRSWGQLQHVNTGANGAFNTTGTPATPANVLFDVQATLKPAYRANARWVANRATLAAVRKLTDADGQYLWQPSLQVGMPATLLGHPVTEAEDMPAHTTTGALAIAFGDFREGYTIVDREGITILRDPYTSKGWVKFFTRKRVGGGVVNFDAIKFVRFSA